MRRIRSPPRCTWFRTTAARPGSRAAARRESPAAPALHLVADPGGAVLIKGGHEEGEALADALIETDNMTSWQGQRIVTSSTHGTGCTPARATAPSPRGGPQAGR